MVNIFKSILSCFFFIVAIKTIIYDYYFLSFRPKLEKYKNANKYKKLKH